MPVLYPARSVPNRLDLLHLQVKPVKVSKAFLLFVPAVRSGSFPDAVTDWNLEYVSEKCSLSAAVRCLHVLWSANIFSTQ